MNAPAPPMTPGPELSEAEVAQAYGFIDAYLSNEPREPDPQADAEKVRAHVEKAPHVFDTGIGVDCSVWIRFSDGTSLSIVSQLKRLDPNAPNPLDDPPPYPQGQSAPGPVWQLKASANTTYALPEAPKAVIGMADNLAPHALPAIKAALQKRGWAVTDRAAMKMADLRSLVKGVGVFWFSTHGYMCPDTDGYEHYCLTTADPIDKQTGKCAGSASECAANRADVMARLGNVFTERDGARRTFVAINDRFVDKYFDFAKNSLVFIDACSSFNSIDGKDDAGAPIKSFAVLFRASLAAKKAGTMLGWVNTVEAAFAEKAATFLFDRALGANALWPLSPPQRPFSVGEVYDAMQTQNLTVDPTPGSAAKLQYEAWTPEETILAPSIRNMEIGSGSSAADDPGEKEANTELVIHGEFGIKPASVLVGSGFAVPDPAKSDSKKLVIVIPGNVTSGPMEVRVPMDGGTITGNSVPLTSWKGSARFKEIYTTLGTPGPYNELKCSNVHLRADIHPFRLTPETVAKPGRVDASGAFVPEVLIRNSAADSKCDGSTGGSGTLGQIENIFAPKTVSVPWTEVGQEPGSPNPWFVISAKGDTSNPSSITFVLLAANKLYTTYTQLFPMGGTSVDDFASTMVGAIFMGKPITLDATFGMNVPAGPAFATPIGDMAELEVLLKADPATTPTSMTEG